MNQIITDAEYRKLIGKTAGRAFVLFGSEDYLKAHAIKQTREAICPDETFAFFNEIRIDAVGFAPDKLINALMPIPMMSERKLVTLSGLNFNNMKPSDLEALCDAVSALEEYDYNTLIVTVAADCLNPGLLPKRPSPTPPMIPVSRQKSAAAAAHVGISALSANSSPPSETVSRPTYAAKR